jgi:hypothetical protein
VEVVVVLEEDKLWLDKVLKVGGDLKEVLGIRERRKGLLNTILSTWGNATLL